MEKLNVQSIALEIQDRIHTEYKNELLTLDSKINESLNDTQKFHQAIILTIETARKSNEQFTIELLQAVIDNLTND